MNRNNLFRWLAAVFTAILLLAVRTMENQWFPEPLIDYFARDRYLSEPLPRISAAGFLTVLWRYAVNSVLSVTLLFLLFHNRFLTRMAIKIYTAAGIILAFLYLLALYTYQPAHYQFLFYIRRLLIHPVLLFILIPAFYYFTRMPDKHRYE